MNEKKLVTESLKEFNSEAREQMETNFKEDIKAVLRQINRNNAEIINLQERNKLLRKEISSIEMANFKETTLQITNERQGMTLRKEIEELEKSLKLLEQWITVINGKVFCKPKPKYLKWFVKLNRDTCVFIEKHERSQG